MRELPQIIMVVVLTIAILTVGGIVLDYLGNAAQNALTDGYANSTTKTVLDTTKPLYGQVSSIISLPVLLAIIGVALAGVFSLFVFRRD